MIHLVVKQYLKCNKFILQERRTPSVASTVTEVYVTGSMSTTPLLSTPDGIQTVTSLRVSEVRLMIRLSFDVGTSNYFAVIDSASL